MHIAVALGEERESFPAVVVERTDVTLNDLFLGNKLGGLYITDNGVWREVGERLGGQVRITTSLKMAAFQTVTRDALADLLLYSLVGPLRWSLAEKGFVYISDSGSVGAESVENLEKTTQALYTRSVSFSVQSEWYDDFFYNGVRLEGFNIYVN